MGLLGDSWEDPRTAAILNLAGGLLSQRNLGAGLVQGMQGYTSAMLAAKKAQQEEEERKQLLAQRAAQELRAQQQFVLQQQLGGLQVNEAARAAAEREAQAARDDQFRSSIPSPRAAALQALGADASPTAANAARMPQVDPRSQFLFDALQARQLKPMDYLTATQKDTTPIKLGANERLLEPKTNRVLVDAMPDPAKMSPVAQLMSEMNALPPGDPRRAIYQNAITKATTHQAPVNVTYGAPVAGVDNNGNPVFFQPGKDGGAPAIVPGVRPNQKLGEKQQNQVVGIDALGQAVDEYVGALSTWKKPDALNADKRAQIGTVYNNMMLQAKEAYNLGVLNGPDLQIMEAVVRNPLTMTGMVTSNEALAKQATDLKRIMNKIKANINKTPGKPDQEPVGVDDLVNQYRSR